VPTPLEEQIKLSPFVLNVMVYGDNKPYNVALVVANLDAVKKETGLSGEGDKLLADPKVRALFKKELDTYGEKFKGFEEVRDFTLIAEDFTTDNGMLTPSLKVKRRAVLAKWQNLIDEIYTKKKDKGAGGEKKKAEAAVS
jgi:long-chain acyl-CoA synthetase